MLRGILRFLLPLLGAGFAAAQSYVPSAEKPPVLAREFRAAWIASVYNIDWPSKKGLPAVQQQAELRAMLDKLAALHFNAVIFQVRPQCDALYESSLEPWSAWVSGTMGKSPGYDPLAFCIKEAHARGLEVHAWFNPFRATPNNSLPACGSHVTKAQSGWVKAYGSLSLCDPAIEGSRARALQVISDVVKRYDIDGVHLDDYFYPYPVKGVTFRDGRTPAQRRAFVDAFVQQLYAQVKASKPWVRVGISPFGIWKPGVPAGIEAGLDSCEDLCGDARKWLANGWVDYLAPQLYWRDEPAKQSFSTLLEWWRAQGSRPVWPGIATARIQSPEDPGRPAAEITKQIGLSRKIGNNWAGHLHWSAKSIVSNRGGIVAELTKVYPQPAAVPPMPWLSKGVPAPASVQATAQGERTIVSWRGVATSARVAVQAKYGTRWTMAKVAPGSAGSVSLPRAEVIAVTVLDRFGSAGSPVVLEK